MAVVHHIIRSISRSMLIISWMKDLVSTFPNVQIITEFFLFFSKNNHKAAQSSTTAKSDTKDVKKKIV
jgi:hypothetical protein